MLWNTQVRMAARSAALSAQGGDDSEDGSDGSSRTAFATRTRVKHAPMFKVLMLNDDFTPMEFVVQVLQRVFHMDSAQAGSVMLAVHQSGAGVCGIYPYEIAETRATLAMELARRQEHPLQCRLEEV